MLRNRIAAFALIACALSGAVAGGRSYAHGIRAADPFVIGTWFVFLPVLIVLLAAGQRADPDLARRAARWSCAGPLVFLAGFWSAYRHPDLVSAGLGVGLATGLGLLLIAGAVKRIAAAREFVDQPRAMSAAQALVLLATACGLVLLVLPVRSDGRLHALRHRGEGILNAASTDGSVGGAGGMYFCDNVELADMMTMLARSGYRGVPEQDPGRSELRGPLLALLPVREDPAPGAGEP